MGSFQNRGGLGPRGSISRGSVCVLSMLSHVRSCEPTSMASSQVH